MKDLTRNGDVGLSLMSSTVQAAQAAAERSGTNTGHLKEIIPEELKKMVPNDVKDMVQGGLEAAAAKAGDAAKVVQAAAEPAQRPPAQGGAR